MNAAMTAEPANDAFRRSIIDMFDRGYGWEDAADYATDDEPRCRHAAIRDEVCALWREYHGISGDAA